MLLIVFLIFLQPVFAAEALQIRSSTLIQIGDHNRNYTIKLSCLEVNPKDEQAALSWLKSELPRRRRVNFSPQGSNDGILIARVNLLGKERDLGEEITHIATSIKMRQNSWFFFADVC